MTKGTIVKPLPKRGGGVPSRRWNAVLTALYSATAIVGVLLVARLFVACLFYVYYGVWPCSL